MPAKKAGYTPGHMKDCYESLREVMIWFWANVEPSQIDADANEMVADAENAIAEYEARATIEMSR